MRALILTILLGVGLSTIAQARAAPSDDWGDVPVPASATVRLGRDARGNETREITYAGGVVARQWRDGSGKPQTMVEDRSGHGAVLCLREIYIGLREDLDICRQDGDDALRRVMDEGLDRIDDFVVANSLTPITKDALRATEETRLKKQRDAAALRGPEAQAKICGGGDAQRMLGGLRSASLDKLRAELAAALSVPRPPVSNPCL
ncbi:hypothetical protein FBZ91_10683 [Nitrospirillum viridazoti]|nr:hypothetical protein FBZ91_10683 [Nitrospirillum amazonense]